MTKTVAVPHPLPEALAEMIARRFRLLAEPTRLRLLDSLRDGPLSVGALSEVTGLSQQNASKHLGLMNDSGLISKERSGTSVIYEISDPAIFELCELVCGGIRGHIDQLDESLKGALNE